MVLVTTFICAFLQTMWQFVLMRMVTAFFSPGTYMLMVVLASELVSEKYRPSAGMCVWLFFSLAEVLLGIQAIYVKNWRDLQLISSLPYLIVLPFLW